MLYVMRGWVWHAGSGVYRASPVKREAYDVRVRIKYYLNSHIFSFSLLFSAQGPQAAQGNSNSSGDMAQQDGRDASRVDSGNSIVNDVSMSVTIVVAEALAGGGSVDGMYMRVSVLYVFVV